MIRGEWEQRLSDGRSISIQRVESAEEEGEYQLSLQVEPGKDLEIIPTGNARLASTSRGRQDVEMIHVVISASSTSHIDRVIFKIDGQRDAIYLPSPNVLDRCDAAVSGDFEAASKLLDGSKSAVSLCILCGTFLEVREYIQFIETVAGSRRFAASQLHSYRYALVRAALMPSPAFSLDSAADVEVLVDGLDAIDEIGTVSLPEAIGDVMATVHTQCEETDELLERVELDRQELEQRRDGFSLVSFLAQRVTTSGFEAAEAYAMKRTWRLDGSFEARLTKAKNAEYTNRAALWRSLVCAAAREGREEFSYVLSNAFYWSSHDNRSNSRVQELLYEAAIQIAREIEYSTFEIKATFQKHLSIGHRLRSSHNFGPAVMQFEQATRLANDHEFLPGWSSHYGKAVCESHYLADGGDEDAAISVLDEAIEESFQFEVDPERLNEIVHHLKAQKHETIGDTTDDVSQAAQHYRTACTHFDHVGFTRSKHRCERKKNAAKSQEQSVHQESQETTPAENTPSENESHSTSAVPSPEEETVEEDLDEAVPFSVIEQLGSSDPGIIGDEEETDNDDPYLF